MYRRDKRMGWLVVRFLIRREVWSPEHKWKGRRRDITSAVTRKKEEG